MASAPVFKPILPPKTTPLPSAPRRASSSAGHFRAAPRSHFPMDVVRCANRSRTTSSCRRPIRDRSAVPPNPACPSYIYPATAYQDSLRGDALWSLFPFPNNPLGPFGGNTFTETLPADGNANVYAGSIDHDFSNGTWHNSLFLRYNGSNETSILPQTGGALFSSVQPFIFTKNGAIFWSAAFNSTLSNTARASFGRHALWTLTKSEILI